MGGTLDELIWDWFWIILNKGFEQKKATIIFENFKLLR